MLKYSLIFCLSLLNCGTKWCYLFTKPSLRFSYIGWIQKSLTVVLQFSLLDELSVNIFQAINICAFIALWLQSCHRVDSCYREFTRSKNYALNNFWWNFTKVIMKVNKVIPEIWLLSLNFEKFSSINLWSNQSQLGVWRAVIGCSIGIYR